ncbi:MAG: endo-1,4-beta-xylanase [Kiritimatiellae bacterium]|nr:endo-1,4-beta-xylanase [Kiritimatiellia bacterium]
MSYAEQMARLSARKIEQTRVKQARMSRRDFLQRAMMLAGAGVCGPLWSVMKYDRDAVLDLFRLKAQATDARVNAGIEENRKGWLTLLLKDDKGRPCETARVKIRQTGHDFKYGANLFMLDEITDSAEKNEAYKEHFAAAFNLATLPFYWRDVEPEQGKPRYAKGSPRIYRRPPPDLCLEWCEAHAIEPKAHCLNYVAEFCTPPWAKGDVFREKQLLEKRFRELAARYAHRIPMWEVTNETLHWVKGRLNASNFLAEPDLVEWSFKTAERYFASNKLVINEGGEYVWRDASVLKGTRSAYYMQIENALLKGCRIDSVGIQSHLWGDVQKAMQSAEWYYDPQHVFAYLDTYARLGKPIQITEITIPTYSDDPGDEALQAELLRNFYRIWFSHPAMEAIIYWNLPDGYAHAAKPGDFTKGENTYYGGLCRFDMTPKPAYNVLRDLFGREWRTNIDREVSGGRFSFRGFYGTYEIEVTSNGKTVKRDFHIRRNGLPTFEVRLDHPTA